MEVTSRKPTQVKGKLREHHHNWPITQTPETTRVMAYGKRKWMGTIRSYGTGLEIKFATWRIIYRGRIRRRLINNEPKLEGRRTIWNDGDNKKMDNFNAVRCKMHQTIYLHARYYWLRKDNVMTIYISDRAIQIAAYRKGKRIWKPTRGKEEEKHEQFCTAHSLVQFFVPKSAVSSLILVGVVRLGVWFYRL